MRGVSRAKRYQFQHLLHLAKLSETMKQQNFKKNLLAQDVKMDASVNFMMNGDIHIYPCPWEDDKEVTDGRRVRYRGGVEVDADGRTRVKRYVDGAKGPKHDVLFETPHAEVKMTRPLFEGTRRRMDRESIYITFKFPKKYGMALTKALYKEETENVMAFLKTRKEETIWD